MYLSMYIIFNGNDCLFVSMSTFDYICEGEFALDVSMYSMVLLDFSLSNFLQFSIDFAHVSA